MSWNISSSPALQGRGSILPTPLDSEGTGPPAVTPPVTSPTMVLRRNIAHCYTDSVTIMAVVCRRTARRALVTPALAQGPQGRTQRSVFL